MNVHYSHMSATIEIHKISPDLCCIDRAASLPCRLRNTLTAFRQLSNLRTGRRTCGMLHVEMKSLNGTSDKQRGSLIHELILSRALISYNRTSSGMKLGDRQWYPLIYKLTLSSALISHNCTLFRNEIIVVSPIFQPTEQ